MDEKHVNVVALGVCGDWHVGVDQSSDPAGQWFLHLETRLVDAYLTIAAPAIVDQISTFLESEFSSAPCFRLNAQCELLRDDEFEDRAFLLLRSNDSVTARFTIAGDSFQNFRSAVAQARDELASEGVLA